jgi:DNA segregation ATPase FtsK/SpoIIIE, S-DNA-T family
MEEIKIFNNILRSLSIKADCIDYQHIDNYFYYDLRLEPGAKVRDVNKYLDEISLLLKAPCKPGIKTLHNQGVVRLEFATHREQPLKLFDYFTNQNLPKGELICLLGQSVNGERVWMNLSDNPHMIVAGTTGSGKSTLLHNIIGNLLNYSNPLIYLMDPKNIEFSEYELNFKNNVRVSYTYDQCLDMIKSLTVLMESRYELLREGMNPDVIPPVVVIIDEFADLILQDKDDLFYLQLCRLAQKCRAAKINIVLATQRPSVNIISGVIKANFPARIACRVASSTDSKVILDTKGSEHLLGKGDALIKDNCRMLDRFQVAYTTPAEICAHFGE